MSRDGPGDRVLAIMAKAPRLGHVKTRLSPRYAPEAILTLYRTLVEDTLDLARSLRVATVVVCPAGDELDLQAWLPEPVRVLPQLGHGLPAALASTFARLCGSGRHPVVALDGDSPHLAPAVLEGAFEALDDCDVVAGPCDDGGYFLVGCTRSHPGLFDGGGIGTHSALRALLDRASDLGLETALTPSHYDVDLPDDVARLTRDLAANPRRAPRTAALLAAWEVAKRRARS